MATGRALRCAIPAWPPGLWDCLPALLIGAAAATACVAAQTPPPPIAGLGAVLVAAALSSIAGFAFSALCGAMLLHLGGDPVGMVQVMMVCSIGIQVTSVWAMRRDIEPLAVLPFLAGGLAALPLGLHLLLTLPPGRHAALVGGVLLAYGAWMLARRRPLVLRRGHGGVVGDVVAGIAGGITGGLAAFPGGPVTIWCGMQGWTKERQRGVFQPFILVMQVAALGAMQLLAAAATGPVQRLGLVEATAYLPSALLGTVCGLNLFRRLTDHQFSQAVSLLLVVSGIALLL